MGQSNSLFDRLATGAIVVSTLLLTAVVVKRELTPQNQPELISAGSDPIPVKNWSELTSVGHTMGAKTAPVTFVIFSDFECPACRMLASILPAAVRRHPNAISIVHRHWPLNYHRFAYPAARAAECAAAQGKFSEFYETVFARQDSLGLKTFAKLAQESGVSNLGEFELCNSKPGKVDAIEADIAAATRIKAHGTPTVIVNGLMLTSAPDSASVDSIVHANVKPSRTSMR